MRKIASSGAAHHAGQRQMVSTSTPTNSVSISIVPVTAIP